MAMSGLWLIICLQRDQNLSCDIFNLIKLLNEVIESGAPCFVIFYSIYIYSQGHSSENSLGKCKDVPKYSMFSLRVPQFQQYAKFEQNAQIYTCFAHHRPSFVGDDTNPSSKSAHQ